MSLSTCQGVPCHLLLGIAFCGDFKLVSTEIYKERFIRHLLLGTTFYGASTLDTFALHLASWYNTGQPIGMDKLQALLKFEIVASAQTN